MITLKNISKKYSKNIIALDDVNMNIDEGEFVFLVGPSGAGKTTILKLLIAEIHPDSGSIYIGDTEVNKLKSKEIPYLRRKIGIIFQDFKLLNDRTVSENIAVSLEILEKNQNQTEDRIYEILKIVQLSGKENFFPGQLSLGEQQRLAIGRAIAGEANILLADEPTGNLDPKTSWEILKIINQINRQGKTVIMATHNVDVVNSMRKRVVMLEKGKIIRDQKKSKYS